LDSYKEFVEINPNDAGTYYNIGVILY